MKIQANLPMLQFQAFGQGKTAKKNQAVKQLAEGLTDTAVKVSISKEGMDACRAMVAEKNQSSTFPDFEEIKNSTILLEQLYGSVGTRTLYFASEEEVLEGKDMTKNIIPCWFSKEVKNLEETQSGNTWRDKATRLTQAYTTLYEEIVQGYQDGTREVRVVEEGAKVSDLAQGRGYRVLTMEEELAELDALYEEKVKDLERRVKDWPKQFEIFRRMDESRSRFMGREPYYTEEKVKELENDYKTVPQDLAQRMLNVRDFWKLSRLTMPKDKAWESVAEIINTMFRRRN